jgi:hypothetical protein
VETHAREQEFAARKAERARAHEAYLYAETVKDDAYTALAEAKVAHDTNPLERQIKNEEDALKAGSLALQRTLTDLKERADCSEAIRAGLEASAPFTRATKGKAVEQLQLLASDAAEFRNAWTSKDHENIRKHGERLEALLKTNGPAAVEEATQVKHAAAAALAELNKEKQHLARVADSAGEGQASISADARDLILELRDARIPAHPVCDVIEIKPAFEPWRNAAEAVLGRSREALIVRDADHHRAISIQRQRRTSRPIEIIKPSIADAANYDAPDSLAAVFETEDPVAAGLISHLTGRIKRVATEAELAREQSAVTKDLMRSTPISTYKMSPPFPLLVGREGRRLAAEDARIQLQQLDAKLRGAEKTLDLIDRMLLAVKTLAGLARDKSWKSISELVQDMAGCLKAIEDASAQIARLKSDRPQEWAEESKKLEAAKAAAGLALMRAKEQSDAAIIATERAESAVAAGLREKEAAAYELFRHQVDDADPAAVARNHHLARTLNHAVPAERLLAITQLRDSARDYEQESARLANEADELWHEHFTKDFPNEALPELPESPKWEDRLAATRKRLNQLSDSTLIGKKADVAKAEKDLAEVFKLEFVGRLVEAFGRIRHAYEDLNNEVRNRDFYGESYIFTKEPEEAYLDIIELVRKAENPNWDMPLWSTAEDESAEQRALARITRFIEEKDDEHLRGLRDPKAYWRFDTKIVNSVTGEQVSNLNRRMRSGSGGEGQIPQYIAVVAAVVARSLSPRRDKGALPLVLLDEAFSQLDVQHTRKIMQFMRELGLQVFLAAPDGKTAQVVHGVDTIINVFRDDKDVSLLVETVTDELRDDLSDEDPRLTGFARFKALRDSSEPEMLLEASE